MAPDNFGRSTLSKPGKVPNGKLHKRVSSRLSSKPQGVDESREFTTRDETPPRRPKLEVASSTGGARSQRYSENTSTHTQRSLPGGHLLPFPEADVSNKLPKSHFEAVADDEGEALVVGVDSTLVAKGNAESADVLNNAVLEVEVGEWVAGSSRRCP